MRTTARRPRPWTPLEAPAGPRARAAASPTANPMPISTSVPKSTQASLTDIQRGCCDREQPRHDSEWHRQGVATMILQLQSFGCRQHWLKRSLPLKKAFALASAQRKATPVGNRHQQALLAKEAFENYSVISAERFASGVRSKCGRGAKARAGCYTLPRPGNNSLVIACSLVSKTPIL